MRVTGLDATSFSHGTKQFLKHSGAPRRIAQAKRHRLPGHATDASPELLDEARDPLTFLTRGVGAT